MAGRHAGSAGDVMQTRARRAAFLPLKGSPLLLARRLPIPSHRRASVVKTSRSSERMHGRHSLMLDPAFKATTTNPRGLYSFGRMTFRAFGRETLGSAQRQAGRRNLLPLISDLYATLH